MKTNEENVKKPYVSPSCVVVPMQVSSMICASIEDGKGNMNVDNEYDWGEEGEL